MVAASAMAIRSVTSAERQLAATAAARARVESLAVGACGSWRDTSAADSSAVLRERWVIRAARNATRLVSDSVVYDDQLGRHSMTMHRLATC